MNTKAKNEMDVLDEGSKIPVVSMTSSPEFDVRFEGSDVPLVEIGDFAITDNKHTQIF